MGFFDVPAQYTPSKTLSEMERRQFFSRRELPASESSPATQGLECHRLSVQPATIRISKPRTKEKVALKKCERPQKDETSWNKNRNWMKQKSKLWEIKIQPVTTKPYF
jgi:hypothetical protein